MSNTAEQNKPICLFDSGIGGLTVLKKLIERFPNENYIYLADHARVPFGDKTKEEIKNIVDEIIEWLMKFTPKAIIMACNTSSALLDSKLQSLSSQLNVPVYGMLESVSKEITKSDHKKISIWATKFVVSNNAYKRAINLAKHDVQVEEISCQKLVPMIEGLNFTLAERNNIINEYLSQTSKDSKALILGCTHYPLVIEDLKKLTTMDIFDPAEHLVNDLAKILVKNNSLNKPQISLYTTAEKEKLERFAKLYLQTEEPIKVTLVNLSRNIACNTST